MKEILDQVEVISTETEGVVDSGIEKGDAEVGFENESIAWDGSLVAGESFSGSELLDLGMGILTTEGFSVEMNRKGNRRAVTKKEIKKRRRKSKNRRGKKQEQLKATRKAVKRTKKKTRPPRSY